MSRTWRWTPPPGWTIPFDGWEPGPGWSPDPSWPSAPDGWVFWVAVDPYAAASPTRTPRWRSLLGLDADGQRRSSTTVPSLARTRS